MLVRPPRWPTAGPQGVCTAQVLVKTFSPRASATSRIKAPLLLPPRTTRASAPWGGQVAGTPGLLGRSQGLGSGVPAHCLWPGADWWGAARAEANLAVQEGGRLPALGVGKVESQSPDAH